MKKIVLSAIALVAVAVSANAQQVKFGPKAGLNISNLSGSNDLESRIGFHVGAVAEIVLSDKFSIQPEVLYSTQGAKYSSTILGTTIEGNINNDYINVPIMAKYYIIEGFSVEAGPQIGFLAKSEGKMGDETTDTKDNFKSTDFGINFGLAYDLPMGLFFNARYNLGLSKVAEENIATSALGLTDSKNGVIQVGVGYKF